MRHIREKSNVSVFRFHEFIATLKMLSGHWYIWELWFCWLAARHSSELGSAWLTRKAALYGCPNFLFCIQRYFLTLTHLTRSLPVTQNVKVRKARDQDAYRDLLPGLNLARNPIEKAVGWLVEQG